MSRVREPANRAALLVEAGEILQTLSPLRFATLLFVSDDDIGTQHRMAEILDIAPSTISTNLQSLEDLPLALTKRERQYNITPAGDTVIELFNSMLGHLGTDLKAIEWRSEADREHIGELLSPLHTSRSIATFFILYSIGRRSAVGERLDRFVSPQSVQLTDVISDVKLLQEARGKSSTRKQIREMLDRFEEYGTIEFDGETITLLEKGQEHVWLLDRLIDLLEEDGPGEPGEGTSTASPPSTQQASSTARPWIPDQTTDAAGEVGTQLGIKGFYQGGQEGVIDSEAVPTIVPAYCLSPPNSEERSQSEPSAVLPLAPTTSLETLADQLTRLTREYGDAELELYWALWSGAELHPLNTAPNNDSDERSQPSQH